MIGKGKNVEGAVRLLRKSKLAVEVRAFVPIVKNSHPVSWRFYLVAGYLFFGTLHP
jgi:hypothetical protein